MQKQEKIGAKTPKKYPLLIRISKREKPKLYCNDNNTHAKHMRAKNANSKDNETKESLKECIKLLKCIVGSNK